MSVDLAAELGKYVTRSGYTPGQLARLSGIPKPTIVNWLEARVKRPRVLDDLVKVCAALRLAEHETNAVLEAAGYPHIQALLGGREIDAELLSHWTATVRHRLSTAPFQVIADLPYFVGREAEIEAIKVELRAEGGVFCLQGMGGIGKTTLAVHLAYHLRDHFPDGVLWARLDKTSAMAALDTFARAYGTEVSSYTDLDSRSRVVRELLARKRALIVLDNAASSEEIAPLLPPTGQCTVLLTTRHQHLAGLAGVRRFQVQPFADEALELFGRFLGHERIESDRHALSEIAQLVGGLPLALAIVACRLAYEPGWTTEDFLRRLRSEKKRLDTLAYDDRDVRAVFAVSYESLNETICRFWVSLGVFGGEDFSTEAAAAVTRLSLDAAQDHLRDLHGLSLVQAGRAGRYRLHPLLAAYARERARDLPDERVVRGALVRYYADYLDTHADDYEALAFELGGISTALDVALQDGSHESLITSVLKLYNFLEARGLHTSAETHLRAAHTAAQKIQSPHLSSILYHHARLLIYRGDTAGAEGLLNESLALAQREEDPEQIGMALSGLGVLAIKRGDYDRAQGYLVEALEQVTQAASTERMIICLVNLGTVAFERGDFMQAEAYAQRGLDLANGLPAPQQASAAIVNLTSLLMMNLGAISGKFGRFDQEADWYEQSLALARKIDHRERIAALYSNLASLARAREDYTSAKNYAELGLSVARQSGSAERVGVALLNFAVLMIEIEDFAEAEAHLSESLTLGRDIANQWIISKSLMVLGELYLETQAYSRATEIFTESLTLAQQSQRREDLAEAHYGLGLVAEGEGDFTKARTHGEASRALFADMGSVRAAEIQEWLDGLESQSP